MFIFSVISDMEVLRTTIGPSSSTLTPMGFGVLGYPCGGQWGGSFSKRSANISKNPISPARITIPARMSRASAGMKISEARRPIIVTVVMITASFFVVILFSSFSLSQFRDLFPIILFFFSRMKLI